MDILVRPFPILPLTSQIRPDELHVWVFNPDQPPVPSADLHAALTPDERDRAERYRLSRVRDQFISCRGLLRRLLGGYLGVPPRSVPITYHQAGKPVLVDPVVEFNLTHTDGMALVAVGRCRLGIDVERIRLVPDADGLVDRFFSVRERQTYRAGSGERRAEAFLRGWTCKEAMIKATGTGVLALDGFDVEMDPDQPPAILDVRHPSFIGEDWSVASWAQGESFIAALAVADPGPLTIKVDSITE